MSLAWREIRSAIEISLCTIEASDLNAYSMHQKEVHKKQIEVIEILLQHMDERRPKSETARNIQRKEVWQLLVEPLKTSTD
jgi:hypothetical protein